MKNRQKKKLNKAKLNKIEETIITNTLDNNNIIEIDIDKLISFKDHPFYVFDDDKMDEMAQSIQSNGILYPIIIREKNNQYEIISGHRRTFAAKKIGLTKVPAIIKSFDDEQSVIIMVDSNLQREELLISEKAFAYKMKYDAIKKQGRRRDLVDDNPTHRLAIDKLSESSPDSSRHIKRYISLTNLTKNLLNLLDQKKLPTTAGLELSFIDVEKQEQLFEFITKNNYTISIIQSVAIREFLTNNQFDEKKINNFFVEEIVPKQKKFTLTNKQIKKYFPEDYSQKQIEETIINLLENLKF